MSWSHVTSNVMDLILLGQFQISTDPTSRGWLSHQSPDYLTFRINLPTCRSTFWINFLNQPFESTYTVSLLIEPTAPLACSTLLPLANVRTWESTPTYWGTYDSGSWSSCRSPTCRGLKRINVKHLLVAVWIQALLDAARTSPLCGRQLRLQEIQSYDNNDESLLVGRPVAPRPYEYRRPGPDLIGCRELCSCTSGIMRHIENDTNTSGMMQAIGRWGWGWGWGRCWGRCWRLRYAMAWKPDCTW